MYDSWYTVRELSGQGVLTLSLQVYYLEVRIEFVTGTDQPTTPRANDLEVFHQR